jgi:hypothetical protein
MQSRPHHDRARLKIATLPLVIPGEDLPERPRTNTFTPRGHKGKNLLKKRLSSVPDKIDPISVSKTSRLESFDRDNEIDSYTEYLAHFLKQELKLPDFGQVKVEITLNKDGCVEKCLVISSQSAKNKKYLEEKLPSSTLP